MRPWLAAVVALLAWGCTEERIDECGAPAGSTATCEEACASMFDVGCRVGETVEECGTICGAATADLDDEVLGRVLSCYAGATSCSEVDGCSRGCGPADGPVPFGMLDGGTGDSDAGN